MTADWQVLKQQPAPWRVPQRWRVRRVRLRLTDMLGNWAVHPALETRPFSNEDADTHYFTTHAEALAYADRRARTVEVELPRLDPHGTRKIGGNGLYSLHVDHQHTLAHICLGGWGDIAVEDDDLEPLALYLLAVAEERAHAEGEK